jgi:S-adenosylmethionine:tRNA ribosyltransferase-isomerase
MRETIHRKGFTPLPPYIRRTDPDEFEKMDRERYQAIYARESGAVAAPTAGLHFTEQLLADMREKGVEVIPLTLHIGLATFNPVRAEDIEEHAMHHEYCRIGTEAAERINGIRIQGGKICAVGTTVVRTLEYFGDSTGNVQAGEGMNDLFIYPRSSIASSRTFICLNRPCSCSSAPLQGKRISSRPIGRRSKESTGSTVTATQCSSSE